MIFSVHIPKTAGTSFRNALKERYGDRLALFYGKDDPATHPLLKVARRDLGSRVTALQDAGIEVLHGHYTLDVVAAQITDPSSEIITWLRDPIDRVVSHYSFIKERRTNWDYDKEIKTGAVTIAQFAEKPSVRNIAERYLAGVALDQLAFVGITERFELGLALLFGEAAPHLRRRYNAIDERVAITEAERAQLCALNAADLALYAEAARLMIDRAAASNGVVAPPRPKAAGAGLVRRIMRRIAR